jgi:D-glycero-D-manno-heptose 1,7-bisphosphate phosphatase
LSRERASPKRALFLDRDGVLIVDKGYVHRSEDVSWVQGAFEAVRQANIDGWLVIVITNQSGVARRMFDIAAVERLHAWMQGQMAAMGAHIDAFYVCPHGPDEDCECRKPKPGLFRQAIEEWHVEASSSLMIGDKTRDLGAARAAGVEGYLFEGGDLAAFIRERLNSLGAD